MKELLELMAWKMIPPKPYGLFHLTFFMVGIFMCIYFANKLKNANDKKNNKILFLMGLFLLIIEIYKELFYYFVVNDGEYDFSIFPFQLCDVPMYICLIVPLVKNKKVKQAVYNFMVSYNLLGAFITFFEPSSLCREYFMMTLHGFIWHLALVFIGIYLALSNRCLKSIKDFKTSFSVYLVLCFIALTLNISLKGISNGNLNLFYLGPSTSPIIVFKDISIKFGWGINMVVFITVMTLGAYFVYLFFYNLESIKLLIKEKIKGGLKDELQG